MRIKTGGMQKGYKYSKKRFWINNGVIETLIFDDDDIPENFIKGRLKKNIIAWNKGLTKDTDIRMKNLSEKLKKVKSEKPVLKYTDDFLKQNYIDNNLFINYWENHGYVDCCKHFGLSDHVVKRIIKLAGLSSPREHSKKVKQLTYTEEWRQAHSDILKGKNTWSKGSKHSKEHIEKQKAAYKKRTDQQKINSKYKEHLTKIKNGTYKKHMTKEEIEVKNILEKYFNCADISYQYFDKERYPFECDFYVKSLDLFIEVNAYWTHGGRNYIAEDITCQQQLKGWEEKSKESKFYINAIYTWTDLDVRKYNYAVRNKLFYISLYNVSKLEEYLKIKMQNFSKITKIKKIVCDKTPVYDIGVPKYSNFILDNGLVVHNCVPYQYFKSTIYEKRLEMYDDRMLIHQIINLERNINTGKIDHPSGGCFTGDTKVKLVDGRSLSFLELVDEYNNNKTNYVYSMNLETNKIEAKPILKAWKTLENQPLVKLTFDNGEAVECTLNHRFMLRDGSYIGAQDLLPGDSLMPLYTKYPSKGGLSKYRLYYEPFEDKWHFEHRTFAKEIIDEKHLVHHRDCNPNNNSPENLVWCSKSQHQKIHAEMQTGACSEEAIEKKSRSLTQWHKENKKSEAYALRAYKTSQSLLAYNLKKYGHNKTLEWKKHVEEIEETFNVKWDELTVNEKNSYGVKLSRINNPEIQEKVTANVIKNHKLGKYQKAKKALSEHNQHTKELKRLFPNIDKEMFINMFGFEYDSIEPRKKGPWNNRYRQKLYDLKNHKVVSIEFIDKCEDVYDIEVADNHNFALAAGIFVHNSKDVCDAVCGSIFNASKHAEQFAYEYGESAEQLLQINEGNSLSDDIKQLTLNMEEELKMINGRLKPDQVHPSDAQKKTEDYFMYDDIIIL